MSHNRGRGFIWYSVTIFLSAFLLSFIVHLLRRIMSPVNKGSSKGFTDA